MKTIFEGTVNGTKYNNVQDYNQALLNAINSGEQVEATSHTSQVEDVESQSKTENSLSLPEFDLNTLNGDPSHDDLLIRAFTRNQISDSVCEAIIDDLNNASVEKREEGLNAYRKKLNHLKVASDTNDQAYECILKDIASLEQQRAKKETQQNILDSSDDILTNEIDFYDRIIQTVEDTNKPTQPSETTNELDQLDQVRRLLKEIFG